MDISNSSRNKINTTTNNNNNNNNNSNNTSNKINIDSINNNINRQKEILRAQQKQQRDNMKSLKKQQEHETMFDFILQWGSLACSKLLFFPIEFPIHALTTFIQSQPTPQQPLSPNSLIQNFGVGVSPSNIQLPSTSLLLPPPPPLPPPQPIHSFTYNIATSSFVENLPTPVSTSLINLLRHKGIHIYDGGMVYIVHNMITILINFIQRSFNNFQTNLKNNHKHGKSRLSKNSIQLISGSLSLLKYALTLPLDVIMTRLIVHKFYRSNNTRNNLNDCTFSGVCKNEGIRALYTGWEVIVLKSLLEQVYTKLDNILKNKNKKNQYPQNQQYQQYQNNNNQQQESEKSPLQITLMGVKILLDYILTVVKVRLNIRNIGLFKTIKNIISRQGIRGLFSGLNTYFLLFPLWMISILVANIIFLKVKGTLDKSIIPIPPNSSQSPKSSNISSSPSTYDGEDTADSGLCLIGDISSQLVKDDSDNDNDIIENNNIDSNQHTSEEEEEEESEIQRIEILKEIQEQQEQQQEQQEQQKQEQEQQKQEQEQQEIQKEVQENKMIEQL
ncbi:hypothetical protein ACTFIY_009767 [Dictyostelium cf. discoideum]